MIFWEESSLVKGASVFFVLMLSSIFLLLATAIDTERVVVLHRCSQVVWTLKSALINSRVSEYVAFVSRRKPFTSL